jgi:predicted RNA-binding Zn-ribbon protein involved in translation (DUF1610 family)
MLIIYDLTNCTSCGMEIVIDDIDAEAGELHCPSCGHLIVLSDPDVTIFQREW